MYGSFMAPHIRLESLPKMKRLPQSETTNILVRQLTCLLDFEGVANVLIEQNKHTQKERELHEWEYIYLAYTEYQSHWELWPMETQSPGSWAAACSPPNGANCPKCLYLQSFNKHVICLTVSSSHYKLLNKA